MFWWLAHNAVFASALAAVVGLLCRVGRPRPAIAHVLWLVVLLKLISPTWLAWPWQWPDVPTPAVGPVEVGEPSSSITPPRPVEVVAPPPGGPTGAIPAPAQSLPVAPRTLIPRPTPPSPEPGLAPGDWWHPEWLAAGVVSAWLIGCGFMALLQLTRIARLAFRSRLGEAAPGWLVDLVVTQARALNVRPPRVVIVPGKGSPFLSCLGRPALVVPKALLSRLPISAWSSILVHELAHLRRRDHWVVWIELLAACSWWWFPPFWFVRRQLRVNAELACDAWVVALLPADRRVYAEALLDVSQLAGSAEPLPALALGGGARELLERRLTMILRDRIPARLPVLALAAVGLLAVIVLPGWLPGQKPSEMPKPLPVEEALKKARVDGKYEMLLAQFKDETGAEMHGAFKDLGPRATRELGQQKDLPRGHWVYVYPYYYIWRDLTAAAKPDRNWGTEQVTGEPNTTEAGDIVTAWASRDPDSQDEWLLLEYADAVIPRAVMVHETFNPGALVRVTVFKLDGEEVEVWKGQDPTSTEDAKGVSVIPFKVDFKVNRVKVYLASTRVPGWNEIDAVGLKDDKGKVQWANNAHASSTYAQNEMAALPPPININTLMMNEERIRKLEEEVKQLKMVIDELKKKMDKNK